MEVHEVVSGKASCSHITVFLAGNQVCLFLNCDNREQYLNTQRLDVQHTAVFSKCRGAAISKVKLSEILEPMIVEHYEKRSANVDVFRSLFHH